MHEHEYKLIYNSLHVSDTVSSKVQLLLRIPQQNFPPTFILTQVQEFFSANL